MGTHSVVRLSSKVIGFVCISPPVGIMANMSLSTLSHFRLLAKLGVKDEREAEGPSSSGIEILILHGSRDSFASVKAVENEADFIGRRKDVGELVSGKREHKTNVTVKVHENADHFWQGYESWLQEAVHSWLQPLLLDRKL